MYSTYCCFSVRQEQVGATLVFIAGGAVPSELHFDLVL